MVFSKTVRSNPLPPDKDRGTSQVPAHPILPSPHPKVTGLLQGRRQERTLSSQPSTSPSPEVGLHWQSVLADKWIQVKLQGRPKVTQTKAGPGFEPRSDQLQRPVPGSKSQPYPLPRELLECGPRSGCVICSHHFRLFPLLSPSLPISHMTALPGSLSSRVSPLKDTSPTPLGATQRSHRVAGLSLQRPVGRRQAPGEAETTGLGVRWGQS